jgi:hypothetical protein
VQQRWCSRTKNSAALSSDASKMTHNSEGPRAGSKHWWREDIQPRLVRGIGPLNPTGTDDERQKGGSFSPC